MTRKHKLVIVAAILAIVAIIGVREIWVSGRASGRTAAAGSNSPMGDGPCVSFRQASAHTGAEGCVSGLVLRAYTSKGGSTFLDFCSDYRACPFSSVIFASDRKKFGDLESLTGRTVELRGLITTYSGRAEIIIHDPSQIHVLQ